MEYNELFQAALGKRRWIPSQQILECLQARTLLEKHGIRRSLADLLVSRRLLTPVQVQELNKEIFDEHFQKAPKLSPLSSNPTRDESVRKHLQSQGLDGQRKLAQIETLRKTLAKTGIKVGLYDLAVARGFIRAGANTDSRGIKAARPSNGKKLLPVYIGAAVVVLIAIVIAAMMAPKPPAPAPQPEPQPEIGKPPAVKPVEEDKPILGRKPQTDAPAPQKDPAPRKEVYDVVPERSNPESTPQMDVARDDTPSEPDPTPETPAPENTPQPANPAEEAKPPEPAPQPSPAPTEQPEKKVKKKEAQAEKVHTEAETAYNNAQYKAALEKYKELVREYWQTEFVLTRLEQIKDRIRECVRTVAAKELSAAAPGKDEHRDALSGFVFKPPTGWRGIPPEAKNKVITDDWETLADPGDSIPRGGYISPFSNDIYAELIQVARPESLSAMGRYANEKMKQVFNLKEKESKEVRLGPNLLVRGIYTNDTDVIVTYSFFAQYGGIKRGLRINLHWNGARDADLSTLVALWDKVAETMRLLSPQQVTSVRGQLGRNAWIPGWSRLETPHYTIHYNTPKNRAELLGKHLEAILNLYMQTIGSPDHKFRCTVRFFNTQEEFEFYGKLGPGVAAYYSPAQQEIVAYRYPEKENKIKMSETKETVTLPKSADKNDEPTFRIIYHEAFHQFCDEFFRSFDREVKVPSWFNEGMGDYFFGGTWVKGKLEIGVNTWRLKKIYTAVKEGKHHPLKDFFVLSKQDYYNDASLCYAQGWAVCYFLLKTKKPQYLEIFRRLIAQLQRITEGDKAALKALEGIDVAKLEEEWKAFVLKLGEEHKDLIAAEEDE